MKDVSAIKKVNKEINAVCVRFCKTKDEADDLGQQAFLKILKNRQNIERPECLNTWVYNVVRNTYIDSLRRVKRETPFSLLKEEPCLYKTEDDDLCVKNYVLGADDVSSRSYERLSEVLNAVERKIVETTLMHGFHAKDVCEDLNLSANALAKTKRRAIGKMKNSAKLSDYPPSWLS